MPNIIKQMRNIFGFDDNQDHFLNKFFKQQDQANRIFILIAVFGFLLFVVVTALFPFKDQIFNMLYPKPASKAVTELLEPGFALEADRNVLLKSEVPVAVWAKTATQSAKLFFAKVNFPVSQLQALRIATDSSFISHWTRIEIDNKEGTVQLTGEVDDPGFTSASGSARLAIIVFAPRATGSASLTFDPTISAIYQKDNQTNIISTLPGLTINIFRQLPPTDKPSPAPTILPTTLPTLSISQPPSPTQTIASPSAIPPTSIPPTAKPTLPPSGGPKISLSPTAQPTQPCTLTSATWGSTTTTEASLIDLNVTASGDCVGQKVQFEVRRNGLGDNLGVIKTQPVEATLVTGQALSSWKAERNPLLPATNPEYYFTARLEGETASVATLYNQLLTVLPTPTAIPTFTPTPTPFYPGDANKDHKIDLKDLSVMMSNFNKTQNTFKEIDLNADNKVDRTDYDAMVKLLIDNKIAHPRK